MLLHLNVIWKRWRALCIYLVFAYLETSLYWMLCAAKRIPNMLVCIFGMIYLCLDRVNGLFIFRMHILRITQLRINSSGWTNKKRYDDDDDGINYPTVASKAVFNRQTKGHLMKTNILDLNWVQESNTVI